MVEKGRYFVGGLGVDSGTIFVGDPCYITSNKALCHGRTNDCKADCEKCANQQKIYQEPTPHQLKSDWRKNRFGDYTDVGIMTGTNYGDGHFPCYITYDAKGSPTKLEVLLNRNVRDSDYQKGYHSANNGWNA